MSKTSFSVIISLNTSVLIVYWDGLKFTLGSESDVWTVDYYDWNCGYIFQCNVSLNECITSSD